MFSEKDLVARSMEDMRLEVEGLLAESKRLREEHEAALQKVEELRLESVESRQTNPELAETLWQEAERLKEESREMLRLSMEKKLRAAEVQHRMNIKSQIESLNNYDEVWKKAVKAGRN